MKVVIDPGSQLKFKPIKSEIKDELQHREGNKDYVYNLTPFVRVSCLQEVAYTDEQLDEKKNNLTDIKDSILVDSDTFDGFQFTFESDFEESYGEVQKIGKTLDNEDVRIKNPRRVPPPVLNSFTATVGEDSDYFTTGQLSFTCNSLEQLQFLVPFLFNPGNSIFVEFGHNTEKLKNQISFFDSDDAEALVRSMVVDQDCNQTNISDSGGFISRMNDRVFESGGAYDYFYGIVNNFNFSLNDSLGFDCTVDLIAASKMKLKAPNTDDYNDLTEHERRIFALTLDSKLKTFRNNLEILSLEADKDVVFSFDNTDNTTYVRFVEILRFLNGDYSRLPDMLNPSAQFGIEERVDGENRNAPQIFRNSNEEWYDTVLGDEENIIVNKPNYSNGEPPVVSYSEDVLLFRKQQWNPTIKYDSRYGSYSIAKDISEIPLRGEVLIDDFTDGSVWLKQESINMSVDRQLADLEVDLNLSYIKPHLMDSGNNLPDDKEDVKNAYINFSKFKNIYKSSNGKPLDVLKKLNDLIEDATNGHWELTFFGEVTEQSDGEGCEKNVTRFGSVSSLDIDGKDTYHFKANSKDSVFTSMEYNLGLDGLLGDQIYMNSLNSSDGSADSQKLNLLLFSNHENNLEIVDKRNREISSRMKDQPKPKDDGSEFSDDSFIDDLNANEIAADMRALFHGRIIVGNTGNGVVSPEFGRGEEEANVIVNNINSGSNPLQSPLNSLDGFSIKSVQTGRTSIDEDGLSTTQVAILEPRLTRDEVRNGLSNLYKLNTIPLVFSPLKETIENLRGKTDKNNQPSGKKKERSRDFKKGGINPLLESQLNISLTGIGGINPLEYVKVDGIPDVYSERGQFCVMNVSHTITPTNWETQLTTRFRPTYEDE